MKISNTSNLFVLQSSLENKGWCYSLDGKQIENAQGLLQKVCYLALYIWGKIKDENLQRAIVDSFVPEDREIIKGFLEEKAKFAAERSLIRRVRFFPILIEKYGQITRSTSEGLTVDEDLLDSLLRVHHVFQDIFYIQLQIQMLTPAKIEHLAIADERKVALQQKIEKKPSPDGQKFVEWLEQIRLQRQNRELRRKQELREWCETRKVPRVLAFQTVLDQMQQNLNRIDKHVLNLPDAEMRLKREIISAALDEIFRPEIYSSKIEQQKAVVIKVLSAISQEELDEEDALIDILNVDLFDTQEVCLVKEEMRSKLAYLAYQQSIR